MRMSLVAGVAVLLAGQAGERRAEACGGCFGPPGVFQAVDSHRMVVALGADESVLWDQFIYSGQPQDFAWVLPVPSPDVRVEIAGDGFVDAIDRHTAPIVKPAYPRCAGSAGGCGWGTVALDDTGSVVVDGVDVVERLVVGPYDTSTITADDPEAMYSWLQLNGYAFPDTAIATLDHYIAEGSAFLALRLAPGEEVSAMRPVRIRFRGFMGSFPLQMVTVGARGAIDLSLWIIAEQRYGFDNYPTVTVDPGELVWDWATETSNYDDVFNDVIDRAGGRAWVTEYARRLDGDLASPLKEASFEDFAIIAGSQPTPYVTRLRTRMRVEHIDQDLRLAPDADSTDVSRTLLAPNAINEDCDGSAAGALVAPGRGPGPGPAALLLIAAAAAWSLRRRAIAAV